MMGQDFENPFRLKLKSGKLRMMSALLNSAVFPGMQGGPLEHVIAAKAVAFKEALSDDFLYYQIQVKKNAAALAKALVTKNYHIISDGTDNHMMLIDLRNKDISGKEAEQALVKAHITVNKNMVPFDTRSPFVTSGIRLGTAALTTKGMKEAEMKEIAEFINRVLSDIDNENIRGAVKEEIFELNKNFQLYSL